MFKVLFSVGVGLGLVLVLAIALMLTRPGREDGDVVVERER